MSAFARTVIYLLVIAPSLAGAAVTLAATATSGEVAAMVCSGCHGQSNDQNNDQNNDQSDGQMPDLSRYNAEQITAMMLEFRSDERPATLMNRLAKGYSEIEIRAIAEALDKM